MFLGFNADYMDARYANYLKSSAWIIRREKRLAMGGYRCAHCKTKNNLQVHHLTYERIFNEEPQDLLPLCDTHHSLAEKLIRFGLLERRGDPVILQAKTLSLLASTPLTPRMLRKLKKREKNRRHRRNKKIKRVPVLQGKRREPRRWHPLHAEIDTQMDRAIMFSD